MAARRKDAQADDIERRMEDVRQFYRLALHREAEPDGPIRSLAELDGQALFRAFFGADEFIEKVCVLLSQGERPWADDGAGPGVALSAWAASTLPLSRAGVGRVRKARTWAGLYAAIAEDETAARVLGPGAPWLTPPRLDVLSAAARTLGRIETADARRVAGWALAADGEAAPLLELWVNDALVAAVRPNAYRRDIQYEHGGDGLVGFAFDLPDGVDRGRARLQIEVRAAGGPLVLGRATVRRVEPTDDAATMLRRELAGVRQALEALEARIPAVEAALSTPLADYAAWRAAGGAGQPSPTTEPFSAVVLIDACGRPAAWIEDAARAACSQTQAAQAVVLIVGSTEAALAQDIANRIAWTAGPAVRIVVADAESLADRLTAGLDGLAEDQTVLLADADHVLEPWALAALAARMADPVVQSVYGDQDEMDPDDDEPDPARRRRINPRFRPAFDPDLARQTPYVGGCLAFRVGALRRLGLRPEASALAACEAVLRLSDRPEAVAHAPWVLAGVRAKVGPERPVWLERVRAWLAEGPEGAVVEARTDELGADLPGAVRVRHAPPPGVRATVIIPTRDALDLLRPCIDSLLARRDRNRTLLDLLVIDHESREPETLAYLADLERQGLVRVMSHAGAFNWALMNNLAAAASPEADVLVFLNNDTVVVTPDWLDELTAQAMRPGAGPVGCRLLYGDGTIQHAGFVARDHPTGFLTHEGVGFEGSDPGYLGRHGLLRSAVAVTGACMAIRTETFRTVGGFDAAHFPIEGNDVDLCLRAWSKGLRTLYDPYVTLYHLESRTRGAERDPQAGAVAAAAAALLWRRWGEAFGDDRWFNPHFDRQAQPFTRLRPRGFGR
jgi:GT2 family glycosyltransferase